MSNGTDFNYFNVYINITLYDVGKLCNYEHITF